MTIPDESKAIRKLSQIGYYRLSGFWYPCRCPKFSNDGSFIKDSKTGLPVRDDIFQDNIHFDNIIKLYIFDKKLRQLMLDGIERIEIYMRNIIAHEIGKHDPMASKKEDFLSYEARPRVYGLWYLVKKIGPSSTWIDKVADLVDSKPLPPHRNGIS